MPVRENSRATCALGKDAFGPAIHETLEGELGKRINVGQIYTTADRLFADAAGRKRNACATVRLDRQVRRDDWRS